jgi:hypothetical protein
MVQPKAVRSDNHNSDRPIASIKRIWSEELQVGRGEYEPIESSVVVILQEFRDRGLPDGLASVTVSTPDETFRYETSN